MAEYPKITQEQMEACTSVLLNTLTNPEYLNKATYSALMVDKIKSLAKKFTNHFDGLDNSQIGAISGAKTQEQFEADLTADIEAQFSELSENIDLKSEDYQDRFRILVRMERLIRSMESLSKTSKSDQTKLSAATKLMDYQEKQMTILEQLMNLEKAQRIESLTRRFFMEIAKYKDLEKIANRYLELLNQLD